MKYAIDETELARLEELANNATTRPWRGDGHKGCGYGWVKIPGFNTTGTERSARLGQYLGADDDAHYIAAACNAVPALVAEVRRLREERAAMLSDMDAVKTKAEPCDDCWTIYMLMREMGIEGKNWFHRDVCARLKAMQNAEEENAALLEKVEAWEWYEEVRSYYIWGEHPYWMDGGNISVRGGVFSCAVAEYRMIRRAAREAVC